MSDNHEKWLEERRKGIGGSDVHHLFSLEPYGCVKKLWYDKIGQKPDFITPDNPAMERGREMEGLIANKFAKKEKLFLDVDPGRFHKEFSYVRGNVDRVIHTDSVISDFTAILECKCPGRNTFMTIKREGLPYSWILQMQHYLYVYDLQKGWFAILWAEGWQFITFEVERDEELVKLIIDECHKFWRKVENGPMPEAPHDPDDKRCLRCEFKKTCQGLEDVPIPEYDGLDYADKRGDINLETAITKYKEAKDIFKEADELKKERGDDLKELLGDHRAVITNTGKAIKSTSVRKILDKKKLEKEKPELVKEYLKDSTSTSVRVY